MCLYVWEWPAVLTLTSMPPLHSAGNGSALRGQTERSKKPKHMVSSGRHCLHWKVHECISRSTAIQNISWYCSLDINYSFIINILKIKNICLFRILTAPLKEKWWNEWIKSVVAHTKDRGQCGMVRWLPIMVVGFDQREGKITDTQCKTKVMDVLVLPGPQ